MPTRNITIKGKKLSSMHWQNFKDIVQDIEVSGGYEPSSIANLVEQVSTHLAKNIVSIPWLYSYHLQNWKLSYPELTHRQRLVYALIDTKTVMDKILNHTPDPEN